MRQLQVDSDCGVDDAFALVMLLLDNRVGSMSTVFGNVSVEQAALNAHRLLRLTGSMDVPVTRGADRPLLAPRGRRPATAANVHGSDGLGGWSDRLDDIEACAARPASSPTTQRFDLLTIGPLTNVACSLLAERPPPSSITIMGGAEVSGNITASAEFNFWSDPEAAHVVLDRAPCPITVVPLDVTDRLLVTEDWLTSLSNLSTVGRMLSLVAGSYLNFYSRAVGHRATPLHDLVAAAVATWPALVTTEPRRIAVDTSAGPSRGRMIVDSRAVPEAEKTAFRDVSMVVDVDWALVLERFLTIVSHPALHGRPTSSTSAPPR